MATTIDAPPAETTGAADNNRGLIITIVVLAIALLALGAWAIYQQTAESETAAPAAVEDLLADYYAAFNNYDGEAIIALTTQSFVHENSFSTHDRAGFAAVVSEMLPGLGFRLEQVGDPIVAGDGPYYAAEVNYLTQTGADEHGISTFVMIDTSDGLKSRNTSGGATDPSWTEATLKNIPVRLGEEDRDVRYSGRTAPMPAGVSSSPSTVTTPVSAASRADDREPQLAMPLVNAAAPIPVTHQHVAERVVAVVAQWINTAISFRGGFVEVDAMTDLPRANIATTHRPGNGPVSVRLAVSVGGGW